MPLKGWWVPALHIAGYINKLAIAWQDTVSYCQDFFIFDSYNIVFRRLQFMAEISEITEPKKVDRVDKPDKPGKIDLDSATFVNAGKINAEAEKLRARRELPKPPGDVIKFSELKDWLGLLSNEMYDRLMIYIYRHKPVINRQFVDPNADNNIDVISGEGCKNLNEDYFIERHGGGGYGLTIKDTDVIDKKKNSRGYFEARLYINETQYPPKLDYREVDWTNDKNKGYFAWARAQRIVDNNGAVMDPTKKGDTTNTNASATPESAVAVMKATMDMVSKLNEQQQRDFKRSIGGEDAVNKPMTELLIAKMKEDSPNNMLPLITTLITQINRPIPESKGDGGLTAMASMMTAMMTAMMNSSKDTMMMMQESNKNTIALFTAMMNNNKGDDDGDRLKQVVEIAKMIKGTAPPETTVTERLVDKGMELILPIANIISNVTGIKAGQLMGQQSNINPNPAGHPNPNQQVVRQFTPGLGASQVNSSPNAPNSPTIIRHNTTDTPPPATITPDNSSQNSTSPNPNETAVINTVQQYGGMILQALNAGKEGWEYGDQVADMFGDIVVQTVAKHGTENLIKGMKLVPEFWGVIEASYGEAHMRKWCDEFINYKKIVAQIEAEGDDTEDEPEIPNDGIRNTPTDSIESKTAH